MEMIQFQTTMNDDDIDTMNEDVIIENIFEGGKIYEYKKFYSRIWK